MLDPLVIVGAGGFGRETADVVEAVNTSAAAPRWALLGCADDAMSELNGQRLARRGIPYLGPLDALLELPERPRYVIGVGNPAARAGLAARLDDSGFRAATLVHPAATMGSEVSIGEGTVICAGARMTTNIVLGRHVHVNPNCTIGHDTVLEDFVSMNPASSVSGDCLIHEGALIGVGAVVLNQLTVGPGSLVGGSACVVADVEADRVVKGVPAR